MGWKSGAPTIVGALALERHRQQARQLLDRHVMQSILV